MMIYIFQLSLYFLYLISTKYCNEYSRNKWKYTQSIYCMVKIKNPIKKNRKQEQKKMIINYSHKNFWVIHVQYRLQITKVNFTKK